MTQQDLFIPGIINEIDKCYLCKRQLPLDEDKHVTVNFKKDDGEFTIVYIIVCKRCALKKSMQTALLSKGAPLQLEQQKISVN